MKIGNSFRGITFGLLAPLAAPSPFLGQQAKSDLEITVSKLSIKDDELRKILKPVGLESYIKKFNVEGVSNGVARRVYEKCYELRFLFNEESYSLYVSNFSSSGDISFFELFLPSSHQQLYPTANNPDSAKAAGKSIFELLDRYLK